MKKMLVMFGILVLAILSFEFDLPRQVLNQNPVSADMPTIERFAPSVQRMLEEAEATKKEIKDRKITAEIEAAIAADKALAP